MLEASVYVFICLYVKSSGMLGKACFIDLSWHYFACSASNGHRTS